MRLTRNGAPYEAPEATTVAEIVASLTRETRGIAVAVNGTVVPRARWATTTLADGDAVEILAAVQGG